MFNKVATFRMLPPRRPAPGVNAPANDNRRNARAGTSGRARAPRLVCRWSLIGSELICHWEAESDGDSRETGGRPRKQLVYARSRSLVLAEEVAEHANARKAS